MNKKEKVVVIIGPTAVGKTALSIHLAKKFQGEIISGDSMQIYKGMDIGTAKVTEEEKEGISHHLLDLKDPTEAFSVAEYQQVVREKITEIASRGHLPIIVGGTGLYIQSVIYDYQFSDAPCDDTYRQQLENLCQEKGKLFLYQQLQKIDPLSAEKIHPNNVRRVIRALEIYHSTGKAMSDSQQKEDPPLLYDVAIVGLTMERDQLYERINKRVDQMMEQGLLNEVETLWGRGIRDTQAVQAIGYKELYAYLAQETTIQEAIDRLKQNSRRYAKRQLTWFRNKMDVEWFDLTLENEKTKKIHEISDFIAGKLHLK
ncbi:tRNA dimethylallyltransferase [Oikeobacillus pervagus]|uniref:tRNA dimethylallyltransferase n=1 Tax=Oikeobacillus pervagus TaxID=1325931 RepID=A0AAJ1SXS8_9BACI|nr:tRNA (adenosine(37)-N6)-dimethylallyltransferase MiaA [Oikeobacillus pervagus]MDQ0214690.1 tRNA dimethylallyltransferase [Oikeobacillus pervagus]